MVVVHNLPPIPGGDVPVNEWWANLPDVEPRITRRATLLAALALGGCSMEPMRFVEEDDTPPPPTEEPARIVDAQFFERSLDGSVKTLHEGPGAELRIATPHVDCVLRGFYVGQVLTAETAMQVGVPEAIAAPQGHELVAFILQGGRPAYGRTPDRHETSALRIGGRNIPLESLFDDYIGDVGWLREWEFITLCVPEGEDVMLEIEDQDRTVRIDLREGVPVEDDGWAATRGFRERQIVAIDPASGVFQREFETQPPEGFEVDRGRVVMQLRPDTSFSTVPWIPTLQWAPEGQQWLLLPMLSTVSYDNNLPPNLKIDVPASFLYRDQMGQTIPAASPETISFEELLRGQADMGLVWPVSGTDTTATVEIDLVGQLSVDYVEQAGVPAQFLGESQALEFTVTFTPAAG